MNQRNNLFSPILGIWECDIAITLIHLFIIWLYLFNQLHVGEYLYFPIHAKDGRRIERWIRSLLHGNGEESFKANRAIFYFPFGAPPVFPLDTIRIKQTDPLLRRNEKLIRKGGGHNRLSFIARLDRETKGDGSQRNFGPKLLQAPSYFVLQSSLTRKTIKSSHCYIFRGSSISWILSLSMIIIFRNCTDWNLESMLIFDKLIVRNCTCYSITK